MKIKDFDRKTVDAVKDSGCPTAEEEAIKRYGVDWKEKYVESRNKLRKKLYPLLGRLIKCPEFKL